MTTLRNQTLQTLFEQGFEYSLHHPKCKDALEAFAWIDEHKLPGTTIWAEQYHDYVRYISGPQSHRISADFYFNLHTSTPKRVQGIFKIETEAWLSREIHIIVTSFTPGKRCSTLGSYEEYPEIEYTVYLPNSNVPSYVGDDDYPSLYDFIIDETARWYELTYEKLPHNPPDNTWIISNI